MNEQQLVQELAELERKYSENDLTLTALKIAGSRVDDVRFPTSEGNIAELLGKASKALGQAEDVARLCLDGKITESWRVTENMRMELHKDCPTHYLLQD